MTRVTAPEPEPRVPHGFVAPGFEAVRRALELCVPRRGPGGAAVSVYHRGKRVVELALGTRNRAGAPFLPETLCLTFSTTKGVTATLLHVLVDRGIVDLEAPVARYWPEFATNGKARVTVRQVLTHRAGLHLTTPLLTSARELLDWGTMIRAIERAKPSHTPGADFAYHAFTFGFILGEVAQRATSKSLATLLDEHLAAPLGLTGLYIGVPTDALPRCSEFVGVVAAPEARRAAAGALRIASRAFGFAARLEEAWETLFPPDLFALDLNDPALLGAAIPAANGMFDAPSLARLYAMLANGGELDGVRLLSREAIRRASTDQNGFIDRIIPFPLRVKMGYHRPISLGIRFEVAGHRMDLGTASPNAFGHFGIGGSGAWADPERNLAVGLVTNCFAGRLPIDLRTVAICTAAAAAADRL
jgi:CubicO group peptidase (beta-lactamase class C family)